MKRLFRFRYSFFIVILILISLTILTKNVNITRKNAKIQVTMIVKMDKGDYWMTVRAGAEIAAKEFNVDLVFEGPGEEEDLEGQKKLIRDALRGSADALVLAANNNQILTSIPELNGRGGIPILTIDSEVVASPKVKSFIGTNNYDAGVKAGKKIIELTGEKSHVAIMSFVKGADNAEQREKGLLDAIAPYPQVEVVETEYCLSDQNLASELTRKIIQNHEKIDVIVALNTISSIGVANEIQGMSLGGKVKVITFDNAPEELDMLQEGIIQATIIQNPLSMGFLGVKYAVDAVKGRKIPKRVDTGTKVIDLVNMFWSENQKLLFPFVS